MITPEKVDIYACGAAVVLDVAEEEITAAQRRKFKVEFFECLWWHLHNPSQPHNTWVQRLVTRFSIYRKKGLTNAEIRAMIEGSPPLPI